MSENSEEKEGIEIVRCGECKEFTEVYPDIWRCNFLRIYPGTENFCSWGEKRDECL